MDMINSPKEIKIWNTNFGGINSSQNTIPVPGTNTTNVHWDPSVNLRTPSLQEINGRVMPGDNMTVDADAALWHEVAGHAGRWISGETVPHPEESWNDFGSQDPRHDPILDIENEFHKWREEPQRYPKYYARGTHPITPQPTVPHPTAPK